MIQGIGQLLVVDNKEGIRNLLKRILAKSDCDVIKAAGSSEALGIITQHNVGIVMLDIKIPDFYLNYSSPCFRLMNSVMKSNFRKDRTQHYHKVN